MRDSPWLDRSVPYLGRNVSVPSKSGIVERKCLGHMVTGVLFERILTGES